MIFTVVAVIGVVLAVCIQKYRGEMFQISINCESRTEKIRPWRDDEGRYYIFLPGYVQQKDVFFDLNTDTKIMLNGETLSENMSCEDFVCDVAYDMEYVVLGIRQKTQLTFVRSGGVATMFLATKSGTMEYIHEKKENEESGVVRLYTVDGTLNCEVDELTLKGRGNASWANYEKKPYTIHLAQEANLLEMGKAQKWILLANAADHSHLRNKMVYDFASEIGLPYSPDCQWVDLYLNGEYAGLYLLSEKNEVHPERVNISTDQGLLVSLERTERLELQGIPYVATDDGQALRIQYPDHLSVATQSMLDAQWQSIENAIYSADGIDLVTGKHFRDLADVDSWAKNYLIDELFGNMDGFILSRYFYYDPMVGEKVYAGPVWDYDLAVGNGTDAIWSITDPRVQVLNRYAYDPHSELVWAQRLYAHSWFRERVEALFKTEMMPKVFGLADTRILEYADQIRPAAQMDRIRWLSEDNGNFDEAVLEVTTYLKEHTQFLKEIWVEQKNFCQISVLNTGRSVFFTVPAGGTLKELPNIEDWSTKRLAGWYYCDTDEPFDITRPITEDIQIYTKWEESIVQKAKQLVNMFPLGILAVIGLGMVAVDWRRRKKSGSVVE